MDIFNHANEQAAIWVKDMMTQLRTSDPKSAWRALRAGLQALRDRLTIEEATQLSAQMPLIIRGAFLEGWVTTGKPLRIRHKGEFLDLVAEKYGPRSGTMVDSHEATDIVVALFRILEQHISVGELTDIVMSLPEELCEMVTGRSRRETSLDH
ncbi:MAG: DUF2267 domain-containing protein [Deltaproteobacteria bacterium]|nr:DUF2267 domain-containing protein [Deltaproteobacteria bacterium]